MTTAIQERPIAHATNVARPIIRLAHIEKVYRTDKIETVALITEAPNSLAAGSKGGQ